MCLSFRHPAGSGLDHDSSFSGLIKVLWRQQTAFWNELQKSSHNPTNEQPQLKAEEYKLEIRDLYSQRDKALAQHRDEYFPRNLSEFLTNSTITQLQNYITNYKPAIRRSVAAARKLAINSKPIFQFPGFHRKPRSKSPLAASTTPNDQNPDSSPTDQDSNSTQYQTTTQPPTATQRTPAQTIPLSAATNNRNIRNQKERPPYKHSRWKPTKAIQDRFKSFFNATT